MLFTNTLRGDLHLPGASSLSWWRLIVVLPGRNGPPRLNLSVMLSA